MIKGKNIVLGVTGGIAAYKACELVSRLKKAGASVDVIMTKHAAEFVSPLTFETLSNNPVTSDLFIRERAWEVEHIALAKKADLFVIAPATANVIGKIAGGIADDMLTTTVMATKAPVLICPAMNTNMYTNPIVSDNIKKLKDYGYTFVSPDEGRLACGDVGVGKLADTDIILDKMDELLSDVKDLQGKTVMITAGGTEEAIDSVRCITNHSSGRMGIELVREAKRRGAYVILIAGRLNVNIPSDTDEVIRVTSTHDMYESVMANVKRSDFIIKAAAPSDYKVVNYSKDKIKSETLTLSLVKNEDIAKAVGAVKGDRKLVIFSAETRDLIENASGKLFGKNADMVIANDVTRQGAGFNVDTNIISVLKKDGSVKDYPLMSKSEVAAVIIDEMMGLK